MADPKIPLALQGGSQYVGDEALPRPMSEENAIDVTPPERGKRRPSNIAVLPPPSKRRPHLASLDGVRVEMSRIYLEMKSAKRDAQDGARLVYVLTRIARVLELTEIERRLVMLETKAGAREPQRRLTNSED